MNANGMPRSLVSCNHTLGGYPIQSVSAKYQIRVSCYEKYTGGGVVWQDGVGMMLLRH